MVGHGSSGAKKSHLRAGVGAAPKVFVHRHPSFDPSGTQEIQNGTPSARTLCESDQDGKMTEPVRERAGEPIRDDIREGVRGEMEGWLRRREVELAAGESDASLARVVEAVERFEEAVAAAGGDVMVDTPESSSPEHPDLVLPLPGADETADAYADRVLAAAGRVAARRNE
jgi:hypothetical protein